MLGNLIKIIVLVVVVLVALKVFAPDMFNNLSNQVQKEASSIDKTMIDDNIDKLKDMAETGVEKIGDAAENAVDDIKDKVNK